MDKPIKTRSITIKKPVKHRGGLSLRNLGLLTKFEETLGKSETAWNLKHIDTID